MRKTRKERISAEKNKKSFNQLKNSNGLIKKGTAVFSTTLLVSLLAFPTFSVSASANDSAETASKKLEQVLESDDNTNVEVTKDSEGTKVAVETSSDEYIREQNINILKDLISDEEFEVLDFENLSIEDIDDLIENALEKNTEAERTGNPVDSDSMDGQSDAISGESNKKNNVITAPETPEEFSFSARMTTTTEAVEATKAVEKTEATKSVEAAEAEAAEVEAAEVEAAEVEAAEAEAAEAEVAEVEAAEAEAAEAAEVEAAEAEAAEVEAAKVEAAEVEAAEVEAAEAEAAEAEAAEAEAAEAEAAEAEAAEVEAAKVEAAEVEAAEAAATKAAATKAAATKAAATKAAATKAAATKAAATKAAATKAAATKAAATKAATAKTYTVKAGDTLNKISSANGVTVTQLKTWNNLSSNLILVGQVLAVNEAGTKTATVTTPTKTNEAIADASTPAGFINAITSYAKQVAAKNDLYASVMIAQAALESGYGSSKLSTSPNYNLFGIKGSYNGNTVAMYTSEWSASTGWIYIPQNFKKYPSYAESLQDNANLLKNGTSWNNGYYSGAWVSNSNSAFEATAWLQGRYATDPSYASKLNAIINSYNLTQYDTKSSGEATQNTPVSNDNNVQTPSTGTTSSTSYTVKSGDTLTAIGSKYGVSVENLKTWNSLTSDTIYVNQKLSIKGGTTSGSTTTPTTSTGTTSSTTYAVKSGDTLTAIGSKYGVSVANLKTWNSLTSDTIYVNQKLSIKGGTTSGSTTTPTTNTGVTSSTTYAVKSGDTLTAIGSKYGVSVTNLKTWNSLTSDMIYVNQKLSIKGGTTSGSTTTPTTSTGTTSSTTYAVKSGDTLTAIGSKYGVSVANLKTWNSLTSDSIYVNQKLTIKGGTTSGSTTTPTTSTGTTSSTTYAVKSGDTLTAIGSKYGVSVANLKTWNSLTSDSIYVDQKLTIKGGTTSGSTTTPTTSTGTTSSTSYAVKSGDTLTAIGSKYGVSVANLKTWNSLTSDTIYVDQKLTIKGGTTSGSTTTPTTSTITSINTTSSTSYVVKSGDTLSAISAKYGVSIANLKEANKLTSDTIFVGQKLVVKTTTTVSNATTTTSTTNSKKHNVVSGDSLWGIAQEYDMSVSELKAVNYLKSDVIFVGQSLIIK
ncbi:muramidase family protein [Carnobacterium pleistocenium]|uniref:muramidase family protein n=1 Tax=Carnobacterium pleistocenium TaxID=181073 RepID=UPI00055247E5|nr:LysM peptidoglycan-binding domain-containing protein [Carnobacterium pleistocenium]